MSEQRLLKLPDVRRITALSTSAIYAAMARGDFPRPLRTGPRAVAWREDEVNAWIERRPRGGTDQPAA